MLLIFSALKLATEYMLVLDMGTNQYRLHCRRGWYRDVAAHRKSGSIATQTRE
jgi:hypothetical protein